MLIKLTKFIEFDIQNENENEKMYKASENDLIIHFYEKVDIDPKDPERGFVGSKFIQLLYSTVSKFGVRLWVKTIAPTSIAAGFWERMALDGYVNLSYDARKTIETQKKFAVKKFVRKYFEDIFEKTLMNDLNRWTKDNMNTLLENELKSVRQVNEKYIGDNMSMSVNLPIDEIYNSDSVILHENKFKF